MKKCFVCNKRMFRNHEYLQYYFEHSIEHYEVHERCREKFYEIVHIGSKSTLEQCDKLMIDIGGPKLSDLIGLFSTTAITTDMWKVAIVKLKAQYGLKEEEEWKLKL